MIDISNPEVEIAVQAVRTASILVQRVQRALVVPTLAKSDRSPVTVADYASQALVAYCLQQSFPGETLVAEEDAGELRTGEHSHLLDQITAHVKEFLPGATPSSICDWIDMGSQSPGRQFWTLDPIDGTKGFLRQDQYAIALAQIRNGKVEIGVLGCPNLVQGRHPDFDGTGSLIVAVQGQGTWTCALNNLNTFTRMSVSEQVELADARLLRSFESSHTNADKIGEFTRKIGSRGDPVLMDSQAKYSLLAAGEGELMLRLLSDDQPDYREKIWDQAAGSIILEEAGGMITDLEGRTLDFTAGRTLKNNKGILASNGKLHTAALEALRSIGI